MKIARVELDGRPRTAVVHEAEQTVSVIGPDISVLDALVSPDRDALIADASTMRLDSVRLLSPLDPPSIRDFSVFEQHIEGIMLGLGQPIPEIWYESPFCYFSNPGSITGPDDEIELPPGSRQLDLELEVAAIIGRAGRSIRPQDAADFIVGYTIFNDWSARDLQVAEMALGLGTCKGKDFTSTLGPWIVSADELERYRVGDRLDLDLRAKVNGRELGDDTLANMAWSFEELVSYASRGTWIRPGDVLGSGTCGSGALLELQGRHGADGYPWLEPGDTVELTVEGIGSLRNTVIEGSDPIGLPAARPGRLRGRKAA